MKFTKTYGIFLIAFIIGCLFVFLFTINKQTDQEVKILKVYYADEMKQMSDVSKPKLEVIDEVENRWEVDENFSYKIKLLETGKGFHGDEVDAKSGEKWLGLFQEDDKFVLKETKLKIKRVDDGVYEDKTGKSVETAEKNEPMFLLKNSNLKPGEVKSLYRGNKYGEKPENSELSYEEFFPIMDKGFVKEFELNGHKYSLKVIEKLNKENEKLLAVVLEGLGNQQVLHTVNAKFNDEGLGLLHWVGDLDKDGKPDIYMSPSVHYNVANRVLFLSSTAKEDNLVEKVAYFWTTGC